MSVQLSPALAALRSADGVRRAWPGADGSLAFEFFDTEKNLRAGVIEADGTVRHLAYGQDDALPLLSDSLASPGTRLLVHRAGKRAVVMADETVTKHLKKSKVGQVATATDAVGALAQDAGFAVAEVRATSKRSVTFSLIPGSPLFDLADAAVPAWHEFARIWPGFLKQAQQALAGGGQLPGATGSFTPAVHSAEQEVAVLHQWLGQATTYGTFTGIPGAPAKTLAQLSTQVKSISTTLLDPSLATPHGLLHRDLHDKQLLWDSTHLGILDVDTAATGEPALDLANLLAHMELRSIQGIITPETATAVRDILLTLAEKLGIPGHRLAVYQQAARIRIACVYSFRPSATAWLPRWIDHALTPHQG